MNSPVTGRPALWKQPGDRVLAAVVGAAFVAFAVVFHDYLSRPFWYDEIWRAHFVSEPLPTFWDELERANTPSALGWLALTRASGELFGWHSWALRLPGFVALPLLAGAIVLLARRFTGRVAAVFAAVWVCAGATFGDLGTQLKPYTVEALAAVCAVLLWTGGPGVCTAGQAARRARVGRRTAAGCLALFAVPLVFVVVPLAVVDLWRTRGRYRVLAAVDAAPAVLVASLHTWLFVGHQSSQRLGTYWDAHFLAGRGVVEAAGFVVREAARTFTGTPPGIDLYDPSLIHPPTDGSLWSALGTGPVVALAFVVGTVVLVRRSRVDTQADGRGTYVVGTLAVAQLLVLFASIARYWPIGPVRTNLFLVPLFAVVVVTGADRIARWLANRLVGTAVRSTAAVVAAALGLLAVAGAAVVVQASSASGLGILWDRRDRTRGLDLTVDAAVAARRLARPGDLLVVGGRLARPGWIYAMEVTDDLPAGLDALPPRRQPGVSGEAPRVPRSATAFVTATGDGEMVEAVHTRTERPSRIVVFVFEPDAAGFEADLAEFERDGWCVEQTWPFRMTGAVTVLSGCDPSR